MPDLSRTEECRTTVCKFALNLKTSAFRKSRHLFENLYSAFYLIFESIAIFISAFFTNLKTIYVLKFLSFNQALNYVKSCIKMSSCSKVVILRGFNLK